MSAYTLGTISKLLAQSSTTEGKLQKVDPKLAALFGNATSTSTSKVFKTVKVCESQLVKNKPKAKDHNSSSTFENGKGRKDKKKKKDDVKLKHKDAAAIRVDAKQKVKFEVQEAVKKNESSSPVSKLKVNVKKDSKNTKDKPAGHSNNTLQDETISSSTTAPAPGGAGAAKKRIKKRNPKEKSKELKEIRKQKRAQARLEKEKSQESTVKNEDEDEETGVNKKEEADDNCSGEEESTTTPVEKPAAATTEVVKTLAEKNAPKVKNMDLEKRTLFLGNLTGETEKKTLKKLFKQFGTIETVRLRGGAPNKPTLLKKVAINRKELHPDHNTLVGYIRFSTREEAVKAAEESIGLMINDNHVNVDLAVPEEKKDNKKAIFVGNLSLKLTDEELWRFFEDCGKIINVRVVRDGATGMGKGFGFVNFAEKAAVELALKKNQEVLKNRSIRISRCVKKLKVKKEKNFGTNKKPNSRDGKPTGKFEGWKPKGKFGGGDKQHSFQKKKNVGEIQVYGGDRLAEIGKLKRKSKKPNKGELRKVNIAKMLTKPTANFNATNGSGGNMKNKKKYFA